MRAEILLAERLGISPSRLWGDETEREFTEHDIDLMLAARAADEAFSPRGIEWVDELDPKARFHVGDEKGLPSKNYAVEAVDKAKKAYAKEWPDADLGALVWPVRLV